MDGTISIEQKQDAVLLYLSGELERDDIAQVEAWLENEQEVIDFHTLQTQQGALIRAGWDREVSPCVKDKVIQKLDGKLNGVSVRLWLRCTGAVAALVIVAFSVQSLVEQEGDREDGVVEVKVEVAKPKEAVVLPSYLKSRELKSQNKKKGVEKSQTIKSLANSRVWKSITKWRMRQRSSS